VDVTAAASRSIPASQPPWIAKVSATATMAETIRRELDAFADMSGLLLRRPL
jgi:hypothetical protein